MYIFETESKLFECLFGSVFAGNVYTNISIFVMCLCVLLDSGNYLRINNNGKQRKFLAAVTRANKLMMLKNA